MALNKHATESFVTNGFVDLVSFRDVLERLIALEENKPVQPSKPTMDFIILTGQSNSVGYPGSGASSHLPQIPNVGVFQLSGSNIIKMNAQTNLLAKLAVEYNDKTGRETIGISIGVQGTTCEYHITGAGFSAFKNAYDSYKIWLNGQTKYEQGRIIVIWHQGESGTGNSDSLKIATDNVFKKFLNGRDDIDYIFYGRVAQSGVQMSPYSAVEIEDQYQLKDLNPKYIMATDCMKYYWLDRLADVHHYDQHGLNELGKLFSEKVIEQYGNTSVKTECECFEKNIGEKQLLNSGLTIIENKLGVFDDVFETKKWFLAFNSTAPANYGMYASIEPILIQNGKDFNLSFSCYKENPSIVPAGSITVVDSTPIFGSNNGSSVKISSNAITLTDKNGLIVVLNNMGNSRIRKAGGTQTTITKHNVIIEKSGNSISLTYNGTVVDTKTIPEGFDCELNLLGKNNTNEHFNGVFSDLSWDDESIYKPVESVELEKHSLNLPLNKTEVLKYTLNPRNATNKNVTFTSNDESIALVDQTGLVTPLKIGSCLITIKTEEFNLTDVCSVEVVAEVVNTLERPEASDFLSTNDGFEIGVNGAYDVFRVNKTGQFSNLYTESNSLKFISSSKPKHVVIAKADDGEVLDVYLQSGPMLGQCFRISKDGSALAQTDPKIGVVNSFIGEGDLVDVFHDGLELTVKKNEDEVLFTIKLEDIKKLGPEFEKFNKLIIGCLILNAGETETLLKDVFLSEY